VRIPPVVRRKALAAGHRAWLDGLPALVRSLERRWSITVGPAYHGGTEAFVAKVLTDDRGRAVLKLMPPAEAATYEITTLRLACGDGCARLLREDAEHGAMLLERLGAPLSELDLPLARRHEVLCDAAARVWRPAADSGLPSGAAKARWLAEHIAKTWEATGRPCAEATVEHAVECAGRRAAAHDDERARLVHGDVHQRNALARGDDFALIDPDGLLAEPEYDVGVILREDPLESLREDPHGPTRRLAARTGLDASAIWEWSVVERVSTGLVCTTAGLQPAGEQLLAAADHIAAGPETRALSS
jgi:streptomycin 6-kinase